MKETPWQDIFTAERWRKLVEEYQKGSKKGVEKGPLRQIGVSLGIACPVPTELRGITQQLESYSLLEKTSAKHLPARIQLLRAIAMQGEAWRTKHSLPEKLKDRSTFDYDVVKLVRRATRKANYLAKLKEHVDAGDLGFAGSRRTLLDYLISKESRHCPGLAGVNSADMMEKVDPWHRGYDLKRIQGNAVPFASGGGSILGFAFAQWQRLTADVPFFLWLEGHGFCTGQWDARSQEQLDTHAGAGNVRQVVYRDDAGGLVDKIMLIGPSCGQLIA
ncbi:MAG: hypothetical protein FJ265_22365, partial [Planctomycetes bacterium]|nr:hypothetical protein [Planctomycetota bacterium]